jgi:hypothetical protein
VLLLLLSAAVHLHAHNVSVQVLEEGLLQQQGQQHGKLRSLIVSQ